MFIEAMLFKAAKIAVIAAAATAVVTVVLLRKDDIEEWYRDRMADASVDPNVLFFVKRYQQDIQGGPRRYTWGLMEPSTKRVIAAKTVRAEAIDPGLEEWLDDPTTWSPSLT